MHQATDLETRFRRAVVIDEAALRILSNHVGEGDRFTRAETRSHELYRAVDLIKVSAQLALSTGAEFDLQRCIALCEQAQGRSAA